MMIDPLAPSLDVASLDADFRYVGYLKRQEREVGRAARHDAQRVPEWFSFDGLPGLSRELQQRLAEARPGTVGAGWAHTRRDAGGPGADIGGNIAGSHSAAGRLR